MLILKVIYPNEKTGMYTKNSSNPIYIIQKYFISNFQHLNHPRTSESLPPDYNLPHPQNPGTYSNQRQSRIRVIRHDDLVGSGKCTFFRQSLN